MSIALIFSLYVKFLFLMTPPFAISVFLTVTTESDESERKRLAFRIFLGMMVTSVVLLFFGRYIFQLFGVTLDAFRIGTGGLLFLTAVSLVRGGRVSVEPAESVMQLAIVPITIPVIMGPASIGALLVYGGDATTYSEICAALIAVCFCNISIWGILLASSFIQKAIGRDGLVVLSKITGLILSAISAEMIFTGFSAYITSAVSAALGL